MLKELHINNFALIDEVQLQFSEGFTVLTGETGSGKSILLSALGLILGDRADFSVIGPNSQKSVTEAVFQLDRNVFFPFFSKHDLDLTEEVIIRREIHQNGKSRAFINDTPVSLNVLKELTSSLFYIHSQYNTVELRSPFFQLELLDTLAGISELASGYQISYQHYHSVQRELNELQLVYDDLIKKRDYDQFQQEEIEQLSLDNIDYIMLEKELTSLDRSEELRGLLDKLNHHINGEQQVVELLTSVDQPMRKLKGIDTEFDELQQRLNTTLLELKELALDASRFLDRQQINPERLQQLSFQLDEFNRVLRKHQFQNQSQLVSYLHELRRRSNDLEGLQVQISQKEDEVKIKLAEAVQLAEDLHDIRLSRAPEIAKEVIGILSGLKLANTKLSFDIKRNEQLGKFGFTDIKVMFSANEGMPPVPIEQAASGGELSRVMLALHRLLSEKRSLPTILFDEIDTGVSGEVAEKIGKLLSEMGGSRQLIAITHLPQVAAKGKDHLKVEKKVLNGRTQSFVVRLSLEEKTMEVARLLSGEQITPAALQNAQALIG